MGIYNIHITTYHCISLCPTTPTLVISPIDLTKRSRILLERADSLATRADLLLWIPINRRTLPRKADTLQVGALSREIRELKKQAGREVNHPGSRMNRWLYYHVG